MNSEKTGIYDVWFSTSFNWLTGGCPLYDKYNISSAVADVLDSRGVDAGDVDVRCMFMYMLPIDLFYISRKVL